MIGQPERIPPDSEEEYCPSESLLNWMNRQFEKCGDIYRASCHGTNVYVIRDPSFAFHVLVENWKNYIKGRLIKRVALLLGNGLMVSEGELWKRQRRMIQPSFHRTSISHLTQVISTVNLSMLRRWHRAAERDDSVNVTRDVSAMILEIVLRSILGEDYEQVGFHFNILGEEATRDLAFAQTFRQLGEIVLRVVARRRREPSRSTDILGMLLQAHDPQTGQAMHDHQLANEILTLIVAGHETTASTLNWMWYLLARHPEVEEKLSTELNDLTDIPELEDLSKLRYSRYIIDECLRLYPAGWLVTRKALRDDLLGDYFVPAGTEIYIPLYFIQRHPVVWEEPERFSPDRFGADNSKTRHRLAMIPFSEGPRNCVGESLARLEMQLHLVITARHLRFRYVESQPPELALGVNLRSKYDFMMFPELKAAERQLRAHDMKVGLLPR